MTMRCDVRKPQTKFRIRASRECIDNSERNSLHWCIFALAVIYSIPGAIHVAVDKKETRFSYRGFRYIFPTPEKSATIASAYDRGGLTKRDIQPWVDILEDPISVDKLQHRRPKPKVAKKAVKRERCTAHRSNRWNGRRI
jgi:hypothetical protein